MYFNLSLSQTEVYNRECLYPNMSINNNCIEIRIKQDVAYEILNDSINTMISQCSGMRLRIGLVNDKAMQYYSEYKKETFQFLKYNDYSEYELWMNERLHDCIFRIDKNLYKFYIVYLTEEKEWIVYSNIHYLLTDSIGVHCVIDKIVNIIKKNLGIEYKENIDFDFKEFVKKEEQYLNSQLYLRDKEYWSEKLNSYDGQALPFKINTKNVESIQLEQIIPKSISVQVKETAVKYGISLSCFFYAVFSLYKSKETFSSKTSIALNLPNRDVQEKNEVGMFMKMLPFIVEVDNRDTVSEYLCKIKSLESDFLKHHRYSYKLMKNDFANNESLMDFGVTYQTLKSKEVVFNGIEYNFKNNNYENILNVVIYEKEESNDFVFEYHFPKYMYSEEVILSMQESILKIISQFIDAGNEKIENIEILSEKEKHFILNNFNVTETDYPRDKTVVELFEEQVEKTPDNTAVVFEDEMLTYAEMNAKANSLAHKLRESGIKPDDFVAIIADRSIEMICGIYGIIKAGGAYVPIDPTYPEDRISFMLEDCKPKAVLKYTTESITICSEIPVIDLADSEVWEGAPENPKHVNKPNDLTYCIYTSGTTGRPKGTIVENYGVVNLKYYFADKMGISHKDRILQFANYIFDASVWEMTMALLNGAALVCIPSAIVGDTKQFNIYCRKQKVTVATLPPNYYVQDEVSPDLRLVITAGSESNKLILKKSRNMDYINAYGPTETTVCATYWKRPDNFTGTTIPIGVPIDNFQAYIMNGNKMCGIGITGELCIAGIGLARGYLNRPELTAEKFIKNPFGDGRMYRTGDLAKWMPDGNIEYLGRIDEQVKIRGFRIELGEIESRLRTINGIKDCAVIARADSTGDKAIYAYYTSDIEVSVSEIRDRLSASLPEYMIPSYMMQIESIPVTRNGKLDRRALPEIEAKAIREYIAPRNETEEKICEIFSEILNVEQVGVKDSFFELGGHSLKATRLINRIDEETGTKLSLKDIFSHPTAEHIAKHVSNKSEKYISIPRAENKDYYPMSSVQKRIYFIQQMHPESVTYNIPQNIKIKGKVRSDILKKALQKLTDRHEVLRTQFIMIDGEPVQKILEHIEVDFEYITSNDTDENLMNEFLRPFDLSCGKNIRAKLVNKNYYCLFMMDMHHIVYDGMSDDIFRRELMSLYNGEELEPLMHQYRDYSEWMRTRNLSGQAEYWKSQFDDEIPVLDFPTDYPRPQDQSFSGATIEYSLDEELCKKIKAFVKKTRSTEYMIFLSAVMILLSKYSRQEDIIVGSPISSRTHRDTEKMLGMFVNTIAMRGKPEKNKTFGEFLAEIREICFNAYENQEYPFEELIESVNVHRDMSRSPLFDVMLVLQNNESTVLNFDENESEVVRTDSLTAKFDMTFNISENEDRFVIEFEYCSDLYSSETANRIVKHFEEILKSVTLNANQKLGEIEMLTAEEKSLILNDFNATDTDYPRDKTVVELLEEQVKKIPNKTALVFNDEKLTYTELNTKANSLAYKLRECGVKPDDFVAIIADRSIESISGIIGILKAGGAYVPIDPTYPKERIDFIIKDCAAKAILKYTTESITISSEIPVIDLADSEVWEGVPENPKHINKPEDLIYCIYTSGTTGKPKGSLIENKSVVRLVKNTNFIKLNEHNVILQTGAMSFDASTFEVWGILLNGGKLVINTQDILTDSIKLKALIENEKVNTMWLTSTLFNQMIGEKNDIFDSLEHLLIGGEKLSDDHVRILKRRKNGVRLTNGYGPTENTTFTTTYEIPEEFENIPIGKPISNTKVYIINEGRLCGIGVPGELCTTGDGLARGYLNRPELTEEKFVKDPFGERRMYRTGDLARWLPDGNIEYLGRIDDQVKIRGFRIELGEIESRIREIESIRDCAVIARTDSTGDNAVYAYYTSDIEVSVSEIRDRLSESLPEYMVPAYMMQIDEIPVTRNGKLDKRALPEIETKNIKEYIAPSDEKEEAVCKAFCEILNAERIGVKDNFFELGGDSIKAIRIISRLRNYGYEATVKEVMNGKTAKRIALSLKKNEKKNKYEQGEVTGKIKPTPIINKFIEWNFVKPEHFNQSMMFSVKGLENEVLHKVVNELVKHHDMLRVVFRNNEAEILSVSESKLCEFSEFDFSDKTDKYTAIEEKCTEIQSNTDLENGPIVKAAVFELGDTKQMMLSIHHLAVDGVSWRILNEDFETLVEQIKSGKEVSLPDKTASFIEWSTMLNEYGMHIGDNIKNYWNNKEKELSEGKIVGDYHGTEPGFALIEFSKEVTQRLLKNSSNAYNAKIDEVLIAGLARAIGRITYQKR